ncbi:CHAT domain-containing protein [Thermogemmatispora sp.]|uniref:CHAT domain-containing protein n=1 Tax=Thermogemmatispora sp. TaxID=1968838 RepID=UPI001D75DC26|nr:CHAT domain-containing tetratricopeptide repeat protein [Thermogemmatispora sp.]MBX5448654.1 CHAT domain-containing protein [Thermogemmatispora sp.]
MTDWELLAERLLSADEEEGRRLLIQQLPSLSPLALARLVAALKQEADRRWHDEPLLSLRLAAYLLLIGQLTGRHDYRGLGLLTRAEALRRLEHDEEALQDFDAAGEEFLACNDQLGWARTRSGRIAVCLQMGRFGEALQDAAAARAIFLRHGNWLRVGQMDANAAIVHYELGHYHQALKLFERAIEAYHQHGEGVELPLARAWANKAVTLAALGHFREALALHEQARATFAAYRGQELAVARQELNMAQIYAAQGYFSRALALFDRSRATFQRHGLALAAAEVACEACYCLLRLNRGREAAELAEEAVAFFRAVPGGRGQYHLAQALMWQAQAALALKELEQAERSLAEARLLLEAGGLQVPAASLALLQAELLFACGRLDESLAAARLAATAFSQQAALPYLARALLLQAQIAAGCGDEALADSLCAQALALAQGQEMVELVYRCEDLRGQLAERRAALAEAAQAYERAVQGIEEIQARLVFDARASFLEDKRAIYERAVLLALRRGDGAQALGYVERAKSRVLGDYVRNTLEIRVHFESPGQPEQEALLEELARLREEQAWFSSLLYGTEQRVDLSETAIMRLRLSDPAQARQEMRRREQQIERLLERLHLPAEAGLSPSRTRGREGTEDWLRRLAALERSLGPRTVVLEYYLAADDLYIFSLAEGHLRWRRLPGALPELERLYTRWRLNLDLASQAAASPEQASRDLVALQENCLGLLQKLYHLLLEPAAPALYSCEHLLIVPYGLLHYLPFHCLFDGVQFLVERVAVSYLPSLRLLEICQRRGQCLRTHRQALRQALVLGLSDHGRLPWAVAEAQAVARLLGAPCYVNEEATSARLLEAGPLAPLVHIAAHGLFRLDAPNFSFIQLADRQLSGIEVFNLDLAACSLVTLSACETGRVVLGGVDEVMGLGRGFLYAGAASLLPTLWKVDDASSAELMTLFYERLLAGRPKALALAEAQRAFLARTRASARACDAHPYFWAAFQLIGDPGPLLF